MRALVRGIGLMVLIAAPFFVLVGLPVILINLGYGTLGGIWLGMVYGAALLFAAYSIGSQS